VKTKALPEISFSEAVAALHKAGKIPDRDLGPWRTMPFLRNRFSHPSSQTILSRRDAAAVLAYHSQLLNRLFQ
jgi:hypothetical protein